MAAAAHVVLFPYPVPGHYIPLSTFAHTLASCDAGIRVTLVHTEANIAKWQQQQDDKLVQMVTISDGLPLQFDRHANYEVFFVTIQQMGPALQRCLQELHAVCPISCLISDPNFPWVQDVANNLSLPLFLFLPDSAATFSFLLQAQRLLNDGLIGHGSLKQGEVLVDGIPGAPALPAKALPFPRPEMSEFFFQLRVGMLDRVGEAAGVLLNTSCELEEEAVGGTRRCLSKPVLAVGPCLPEFMVSGEARNGRREGGKAAARGSETEEEEEEVMRWLDAQLPTSVLYISFGSLAITVDALIWEIWEGLRASKQPFLWATRSGLAKRLVADAEGEEEQGRRVVEWAPQQQVLRHPAVAAFMTHCGWNAALEGVAAGAPMLCCPQFLDQPLISSLIVKVWRVGLQVVESGQPLQRSAVERVIRLMLHEEDGKLIKQRASLLRQTVITSLRRSPPGSSIQNLHSLIELIKDMHPIPLEPGLRSN